MCKFSIYVWHPLFKQVHDVEANDVYDAIEIVRDRYNVTDDKQKTNYHVSSIWQDDVKIIDDIMLYNIGEI